MGVLLALARKFLSVILGVTKEIITPVRHL